MTEKQDEQIGQEQVENRTNESPSAKPERVPVHVIDSTDSPESTPVEIEMTNSTHSSDSSKTTNSESSLSLSDEILAAVSRTEAGDESGIDAKQVEASTEIKSTETSSDLGSAASESDGKTKPTEETETKPIVEVAAETKVEIKDAPVVDETVNDAENKCETDKTIVADKSDSDNKKGSQPKLVAKKKPAQEKVENSEPAKTDVPADKAGWANLGLSDNVQLSILESGYDQPTPIQQEIIPYMMDGRDVLAQSQTGTGKTAAFALPILSRLSAKRGKPQVLVLAPTRELAIQVAKSFATYGSCIPDFGVSAIYGGQDYEAQFRQLKRGVHVVVGTPGRVIDHINRGTLDLSELKCLVLDEADEMLNMGFVDDVEYVLQKSPKQRQIALFSATLPQQIRNISQRYLSDPAKVTIKQKTMTADSIRQRAVFVSPRDKVDMLIRFLEAENADGVMVFTRTRETTTVVAEKLHKAGLSAVALNGDMPQRTRERTIQRLKTGQLDIVVATDVAARGLDVTRISHVFNFDLPDGSESYVHRVGRTGRAGRPGEAIIFLTHSQKGKLRMIERVTRQPIQIVDPPSAEQINNMRVERFKGSIDETIQHKDLKFFLKLIEAHSKTTEHSMLEIAAAIAHLGLKGKDFHMKDRPKRERKESKDRDSNGRRDRNSYKPEAGKVRYRLAVGRRDGVGPGNIVGAIANEAGLDGDQIGPIKIQESYSTVDLPSLSRDVQDILHNTWISGRQMKLKPAEDGDDRSSYRSNGRRNDRSGSYDKRRSSDQSRGRSKSGGGGKSWGGARSEKRSDSSRGDRKSGSRAEGSSTSHSRGSTENKSSYRGGARSEARSDKRSDSRRSAPRSEGSSANKSSESRGGSEKKSTFRGSSDGSKGRPKKVHAKVKSAPSADRKKRKPGSTTIAS